LAFCLQLPARLPLSGADPQWPVSETDCQVLLRLKMQKNVCNSSAKFAQ